MVDRYVVTDDDLGVSKLRTNWIPRFEGLHNAQSAHNAPSASETWVGAAYWTQAGEFNRLTIMPFSITGTANLTVGIYQAPGGDAGVAALKASFSTTVSAAGVISLTPTQGTVTLEAGSFFLLWGSTTAAPVMSLRGYAHSTTDLFAANVQTHDYPTGFRTVALINAGLPATLNPILSANQVTVWANTGAAPIIRVRKV